MTEQLTQDQVKSLLAKPIKRHKHNAKPFWLDGDYWHSSGEYRRWQDLQLMEREGLISDLRRQVKYELHCPGGSKVTTYTADFVYIEGGQEIVEDFKGHRTEAYQIKKRWMREEYGIEIRETGPKKRKGR